MLAKILNKYFQDRRQDIIRYCWFILLLPGFVFYSCRQTTNYHPIEFYHWKTSFSPDSTAREYFNELSCGKLYLRVFDVDKEGGAILPKAIIKPFDPALLPAAYIPVVFITNRTLQGIDEQAINNITQKIYQLILEIEEKNRFTFENEIQIDCDWTESTRENYFRMLNLLMQISGKKITCTLRLHQIKFYQKTGVPPVHKGYLMCYATSEPADRTTTNSILDLDLLKDYTSRIEEYPLRFDIALPLYSWAVVTNHLGRIKLINGVTEEDIRPKDFIPLSNRTYRAERDLFLKGMYINKDFTVRVESISPELLRKAKEYLNTKIKNDYSILYYHLDDSFLNKYTIKELL